MAKREVLRQYFGHSSFRPGQEALIDGILAGRDALGIMPTGGLEFLADDELLEVTPENLRLRKRILNHEIRMKALKGNKKYQNL